MEVIIMMDDTAIRFPVKCPCCGQESLAASRLDTIVNLLETERRLKLTSECAYHRVTWIANEIERNQIQEYAAAVQLTMSEQTQRRRRYARAVQKLPPLKKPLREKVALRRSWWTGR
jgi:hypothetical protein